MSETTIEPGEGPKAESNRRPPKPLAAQLEANLAKQAFLKKQEKRIRRKLLIESRGLTQEELDALLE